MANWSSKKQREEREQTREVLQGDIGRISREVSSLFKHRKDRAFLIGDWLLDTFMKPVPRTLLAIFSLFMAWLLL